MDQFESISVADPTTSPLEVVTRADRMSRDCDRQSGGPSSIAVVKPEAPDGNLLAAR